MYELPTVRRFRLNPLKKQNQINGAIEIFFLLAVFAQDSLKPFNDLGQLL
jgi:hypothetical protein